MSDNLNNKMPDSELRKKEQELNKILDSVNGGLNRNKSGSEWENGLTSAIAKRSRNEKAPESYEKILDELADSNAVREEPEKAEEEVVAEAPQNDVQELIEQLTVAQRVTEMTQNKKNAVSEEKKIPEVVSHERLQKKEELEKTLVYNVPKRTTQADTVATVEQALMRPPLRERKPIRQIVRVEKAKSPESAVEARTEANQSPVKSTPAKNKSVKKKKRKKTFKEKIMGLLPNKEDSVIEKIRKVIFMCSICAIIVCGYMVGDYYIDLWKSENLHNDIAELYDTYPLPDNTSNASNYEADYERVYTMLDGAKKLLDRNPDVAGYITVPNTPISNPIMQSEDNKKYLHMNIDGEDSRAGEIFLDYRNHFDDVTNGKLNVANSDNLVIYGHNMANESMFGSLKYYQRDDSYYSKHPIIYLNSNYECYTYKIFAYFLLDALDSTETAYDCWNKLDFKDEKDFYDFVNDAKKRSITLNDVDVKYGDKLITLSTCNTVLGESGRLIIMGRLLRDNEKPFEGTKNSRRNNNIKWPSIYYNAKPNEKYDPDAEFVPYGSGGEE